MFVLVILVIVFVIGFDWVVKLMLIGGLMLFGVLFVINLFLYSYLIVSMVDVDGVLFDVGFYYMVNVMGCLIGIVLLGLVF